MFIDSILDSFFSLFSHDLAIDMGSENLRIFVKNKGVAVNEPLLAVIHKKNGKIFATGFEAKKMIGRVPEHVKVVRPISEGVIVDFNILSSILKTHIETLHKSYGLLPKIPRPKVLVTFTSDISPVEKKAIRDSLFLAGARRVVLISKLQAGAVGAGFDFSSKKGVLIIDFGASTTEIGIASPNGLIFGKVVKIGGRTLNTAIVNFIRLKYGVLVGDEVAEEIKVTAAGIPNTRQKMQEKFVVARGRDMESSLPRSIKISSNEINETLMPQVNLILDSVREIIEKAPPEFLSDVADLGIILIGGASVISGLPESIMDAIKTNVWVAKDPGVAVLKGMGKALTDSKILIYEKTF